MTIYDLRFGVKSEGLITFSPNRPYYRNYKDTDDENYDVQGQANLDIVGEAIAADALYEQVCLIADGRGKGCRCRYADANEEGHRIDIQLLCNSQGQGEGERGGGVVGDEFGEEVRDEEEDGKHGIGAVFCLSDGVGTGNAAKISGMPDYVHRLQKPLHIFCKNAVGIVNQAFIHINILQKEQSSITHPAGIRAGRMQK